MTCITNLLNGNLTDAKRQALRQSHKAIRTALIAHYGYSEQAAQVTADYLKGQATWEEHCAQLDKDNKESDAARGWL